MKKQHGKKNLLDEFNAALDLSAAKLIIYTLALAVLAIIVIAKWHH